MNALVPLGINAFIPADMDQAIRLAQAMASSKMVPKHLQGDAGTCLMIIEQSLRWQMSPFAVAQCTSSIGSKLMFEGKLVAAAVESSGAIEGGFDYKFDGEGDARQVTVSARRRGETNPRQMTIHLKDVRTTNEWWKKQPDQMLVYSGTRNWARRWTPAVILGVYAPEEFDRAAGKVVEPFTGVTIDAAGPSGGTGASGATGATGAEPAKDHRSDRREQINAEVPLRAAAAEAEKSARKVDPTVYEAADGDVDKYAEIYAKHDIAIELLDERIPRRWMDNLEMLLTDARSQDVVVAIGGHHTVSNAIANAPPAIKARVSELLANAYARFAEPDELPEIVGADKVLAG
jgi:hypothetical protein